MPSYCEDPTETQWIRDRLLPVSDGGGILVGALAPTGFEAYCRIFHPAHRYVRATGEHLMVRWSEVAAQTGTAFHPLTHWHNILGHPENPRFYHPGWGTAPCMGRLDPGEARLLASILGEFTETPSRCCFCLWEGGYHEDRKGKQPVEIGGYHYFVFLDELKAVPTADSPNFWWPADRAWCVATDIDSFYTLVGGKEDCIDRIISHPGLEALPVRAHDQISLDIGHST